MLRPHRYPTLPHSAALAAPATSAFTAPGALPSAIGPINAPKLPMVIAPTAAPLRPPVSTPAAERCP